MYHEITTRDGKPRQTPANYDPTELSYQPKTLHASKE